ncbi:hypothetical protein QJS04_geneDACA003747 [Acorus gramineus]|uniref:Uncharacterized protein n=1 Tax=Acorus gramineus TaxID=55184 RepID=A0AAV9BK00_ACOGR|nr:hypothetical protein QJS04_geneDACA003747 [Acorus gramineus]
MKSSSIKGGLITSSLKTTEGPKVGGLEVSGFSSAIRGSIRLNHPIPSAEAKEKRREVAALTAGHSARARVGH